MPVFPKNGRTTIGGQHLLHGVPLSTTEIVKDPKCPVLENDLPELLGQQTTALIGNIGITELSQGMLVLLLENKLNYLSVMDMN